MENEATDKSSFSLQILEVINQNRLVFALLVIGILTLLGGIIASFSFGSGKDEIEILTDELSTNDSKSGKYIVEVSGEVKSPGVYELEVGMRVDDAMKAAGGLTENADTSFVERSINKAAKISDGQKIYIPNKDSHSDTTSAKKDDQVKSYQSDTTGLLNINVADTNELEKLWGIGPAYASKIIEQRPYSDINELITKKVIPQNVFDRIKNEISVY